MKKFVILSAIILSNFVARADHITGGEMFYTYRGLTSSGDHSYSVTLKFFMRCNSGRQFYNPAIISIFNRKTADLVVTMDVPLASQQSISIRNPDPCITNPPPVCYEVGFFEFTIALPPTPDGYKLASQVTYRIAGINNLAGGSNQVGATYTAEIPGTGAVKSGPANTSAIFTGSDLVIVCADNPFTYSFEAVDKDGDQLRYSFCEAFTHSNGGVGTASGIPPGIPPYQPVPYAPSFSGQNPLGSRVTINSATGLITGVAPSAGPYVVTVCVDEIRNGIVIATQRKDLQINIAPCAIAGALLSTEYMLCKNTKSLSLANQSVSPLIKTQNWTIFDQYGQPLTSSGNLAITYTFPDTGVYKIKLVVNSGLPCSDSTTSVARVYPGFVPGFTSDGVCFNKPTHYKDATTSVYGTVNSWTWDFGEPSLATDVSNLQSPTYTFPSMGRKYATLAVGNSLGCKDTAIDYVTIIDKPPVNLVFKDTLICVNDNVQLLAGASGTFSWSPNFNIINSATKNPTVSPTSTTTYYVDMDDNGCVNRDSVKVRVTDHVNLVVMNDTTICEGDTIQLHVVSDGFKYAWSPAHQLVDPRSSHPSAITKRTTAYQVTSSIGSCSATETVVVNTVPYPIAYAGYDTVICAKTTAQLRGTITGTTFAWSPSASLVGSSQLNPVAIPKTSTTYRLTVYDDKGCPKPGVDEVIVTMLPPIQTAVTGDTLVITGQPLQLNAAGGVRYIWSPATSLSNPNIANPVATFNSSIDNIRYQVRVYNQAGCYDSAFVSVKVFKTSPTVFVPNAFTPNHDGKNDFLRPIGVGIQNIEYFRVYNRWGQLMFATMSNKEGWDGTLAGKLQSPGAYVWAVKGIDYTGKPYVQKGTAVLVR